MTKVLNCLMGGYTTHIEAETEDEVMEQAAEHAASAHPDVELDEETVASIRSGIRGA